MKYKFLAFAVIVLWIVASCACVLTGCTATRYVTVPEYHEVVVHQRDTTSLRDSIFVHDSVCITHWGDTVIQSEYHIVYRDRWRDRLRVDSFVQRDTVTVVKEVEKPPNWWQRKKMQLGTTLLWMLAAAAVFLLARVVYNRFVRAGR